MEIDFEAGLKNPEKAKEVVKQIQTVIDDLTTASLEAIEAAKLANANATDFEKQVILLTQSNVDLADAIKNIHLKLNQYAEIVDQAEELAEIRKELAKFVISSGMIKLGVMGNN